MLLLGYLLGFLLIYLLLRRRSERVRSLVLVGYNYIFAILIYTSARLSGGYTGWQTVLSAILTSMYKAPPAMAFRADMSSLTDLQSVCIFYLMSLYTVRTVAVLLFRRAINRMKMGFRLHRAGQVYVVWGDREDAAAMLKEIHSHVEHAAALWLPFDPQPEQEDLAALTVGEAHLDKMDPDKEYHVVVLPDQFHNNVSRLRRLDKVGARLPKLHVTAFLDSDLLRLEDLRMEHADAYLTSREELLVQNFLHEHLPLQQLKQRGGGGLYRGVYLPHRAFSLCVVGFGSLSREFLLATYEATPFETAAPDGDGLDALVISDGIRRFKNAFLQDFPQLAEERCITWRDEEPEDPSFFRTMEQRASDLDQILIATGDTERNIDTATRLLRLFRKLGMEQDHPMLVVALHQEADGTAALLADEKNVCFLQENDRLYSYEQLILRSGDQKARAIHERYRGKNPNIAEWRRLGTFTRASNRATVRDKANKLLLCREDLHQAAEEEQEEAFWRMAEYEHRRWNAFHFARGWTRLPVEELTEEERRRGTTKRPVEKRHICLVPWEELDALPQTEPGILKRYDYENIRQLLQPEG